MTNAESSSRGPVRPVVTLAAFHGANGRFVGPRLAERLGVPLLDRGILAGVAARMQVPERRRIMRLDGLDRGVAERRVLANDRARIGYIRRSYGIDPKDPGLYHLWIDSIALDVDTCVELIVTAARARVRRPADDRRDT